MSGGRPDGRRVAVVRRRIALGAAIERGAARARGRTVRATTRARRRAPSTLVRASVAATLAATSVLAAAPLAAHEYWLDPLDATPEAGGRLLVNVRNGEDFVGTSLPFDARRMARLALVGPGGDGPIAARLGDFPAVQVEMPSTPGLHAVVLDTAAKDLVYDDLERFTRFLDYHGQDGVLDAHAARELPERDIRERYFRHAKALVKAGDVTAPVDADAAALAPQGQALELVAENDPYVEDALAVRLYEDGAALAGAQIELFERTLEGEVTRRLARSDADGRATFDVGRPGEYLVNAVRVLEPGDEALAAADVVPHWQSRWASLTFERPAARP